MSKEKIEPGDIVQWKAWGPNSSFNLPLYTVIDIKYPSETGVDMKLEEKKDTYYWTHLYNEDDSNFIFIKSGKEEDPMPAAIKNNGWGDW